MAFLPASVSLLATGFSSPFPSISTILVGDSPNSINFALTLSALLKDSFSLYEFAKKEYDNLESRTEEEKKELLKNLSLINGYLRNYSFAVAADAVSALISACLNGKEPWKNMYREE